MAGNYAEGAPPQFDGSQQRAVHGCLRVDAGAQLCRDTAAIGAAGSDHVFPSTFFALVCCDTLSSVLLSPDLNPERFEASYFVEAATKLLRWFR